MGNWRAGAAVVATPLRRRAGKAPRRSGAATTAALARPQAGFTLLEVLVSIVILAAIVGLMTVAFRQASDNWTYRAEEIDAYKLTRTICDQIGIELEQAIVRGSAGLAGSSSALEFYCSMDPPTTNTLSELRRVRYALTSATNLNMLTRSEELYDSSGLDVLGGGGWDTTTTIGNNQIRSLSFQYASATSPAWSGTWSASSNLPAAVKIALTVIGGQTARRLENLTGDTTQFLNEYQVVVTNIVHLRNAPVN
jgi:prepilin-type N-terminal cleavage/methylation domain-containing protein